MDIIQSIQNSAEGWKMIFADAFGGASEISAQKTEIGGALIGSGFSAAQERYVGIKAGGVMQNSAQAPGEAAPVGVRYRPPYHTVEPYTHLSAPPYPEDPGTPATVVATIQKSISNSAEGWRMGYAAVAGKAKESFERSIAGWQMLASDVGSKVSSTVGGVGESFGDAASGVGDWFGKVTGAMAVMSSIGYSGVGGPAARIAETEHARRR
jgi:hypothetical protein